MNSPVYASYQSSGEEWLGILPSHWDVLGFKRVVSLLTSKASARTFPVALENIESRSGRLIETEADFSGDGIAFKRGDILYGKLRPYLAKVYVALQSGEAIGDFHVLRPQAGMHASYLAYLLLTDEATSILNGSTHGAKMPRVSWEFLGGLNVPRPTISEQRDIATFLDNETCKVDDLVSEQRRLIELLKEKRQAAISHAVTKGLSPTVPSKESGDKWLGCVPLHWTVCRLKHRAQVKGRIGFRGYTVDDLVGPGDGAIALGGSNLGNGKLRLTDLTYLSWSKYEESPEIMVRKGDVLIGQRGTCGKVSLVEEDIGPATINPSLVILKEMTLHPKFATFFLMSNSAQRYLDSYLSKTAVPMLTQEQIGNTPIVAPPITEQEYIAENLEHAVNRIDLLVSEAELIISLLQERRASMIFAAVTGKIDVRTRIDNEAKAA